MSIDDLAVAIQKGYLAMCDKMDALDKKIGDMVTKADLDKKLWRYSATALQN